MTRLVAAVTIQLGAAVFILHSLGVNDLAAQTIKAAAVQQHRHCHRRYRQYRHDQQYQQRLPAALGHTPGMLLLDVAQGKLFPVVGVVIHSTVHPHTILA